MTKKSVTSSNPSDEEKDELTQADSGSKSGYTYVACKIPNGLILRLFDMIEVPEMTPNGPRTIKVAQQRGEPIKINGSAVAFGKLPEHPIPGGYGLTQIRESDWNTWCEQNKDSEALRSGMLFACTKQDAAASRARAQHKDGLKSGLEPLDPKKLPPVGFGIKVETATDDVKAA